MDVVFRRKAGYLLLSFFRRWNGSSMGMIPVLWVGCKVLSVGETPCQQKHG